MRPTAPGNPAFRRSTLFPILSNPAQLWSKGYVVPGILTVVATLALFGTLQAHDFTTFVSALAYYIAFVQCMVIYLLCGRRQLWWMMLAVFALSYALTFTPLFEIISTPFRPDVVMRMIRSDDLVPRFIGFFFAAGLAEELYKAVPLLALAAFAIYRSRSQSATGAANSFGLNEPLDGIALGVAAAAAFALPETLGQYVPGI